MPTPSRITLPSSEAHSEDGKKAKESRALAPENASIRPTRVRFSPGATCYFDFVRVVATNLVLVAHASARFDIDQHLDVGALGVVLFFLLSGFLITTAALRRWDRAGNQFGPFMIDRCARIFVPFLPALVCVALADSLFSLGDYGQRGINRGPVALLANAFLLNDYPLFQAASRFVDVGGIYPRSYNTAEPFWTIPLEFWTYVSFGLLVFVWLRKEKLATWIQGLLFVVAGSVFLWNAFGGAGECLSLVWVFGGIFGYFWFSFSSTDSVRSWGWVLVLLGLVGCAGRSIQPGFNPFEFQQAAFLGCILFGAFFLVDRASTMPASRSSEVFNRVMAHLASYSYSLYLTHNTVLILFKEKLEKDLSGHAPALAMVASHCVAYAFFLVFEKHYRVVGGWLKRQLPAQVENERELVALSAVPSCTGETRAG